MIKAAGHALADAIKQEGNAGDFIGHMGGDKFVIITTPEKVEAISTTAQKLFVENTEDLYSPTDRHQGYMVTMNRQGLISHVKLCALDFDVVSSEDEPAPQKAGGA
jgi:GGDEF domain-containing protein